MDYLMKQAWVLILIMSLGPILAIACTAGVVSFVQALVQVQEGASVHLARIIAVSLVILLYGEWAMRELVDILHGACDAVEIVGRAIR